MSLVNINRWNLPYPCSPENEGFIYKITEKRTGRFYIGKKSFWKRSRRRRRKVQSTWRTYASSSLTLKSLIRQKGIDAFEFKVLRICKSKMELIYYEMHYQVQHNAILDKNSFNINLGTTRVRMK